MPQSFVLACVESNSPSLSCDCLAHRFGNAADRPVRTACYVSDMTEAEWQIVRAVLPVPAWLEGRGGRPEGFCHRQMIDQYNVVKGELAVSRVR
ncbi:transposase [Streptomyces sp. NPDC048282]|uniref:transposase n=1 Tax=Streptomyces sp. NPDC048282 TaxID=3365528 RepID=UPI003713129C